MKRILFLSMATLLLSACSDDGSKTIGGVFFTCSYDPNRERHFAGMPGNDSLEPDAMKSANAECERYTGGGVALDIVYVYKDGSQKAKQ